MTRSGAAASVVILMLSGCRPTQDAEVPAREKAEADARGVRLQAALTRQDSDPSSGAPLARWLLPPPLQEISGLALTPDGRLFAHGDEQGEVWEVDYRRGVLVKRFTLGNGVMADFEGITVAGDVMFMIASNGVLYEFPEGADNAHVPYKTHDTGLGNECEFEGVAFEPATNALLLACKNVRAASLRESLVIYRWTLAKGRGVRAGPLIVPLARVIGQNGWRGLHPSDITVDAEAGHYVIIASQEKALVEITPAGEVVASRPLPGVNAQPEGVAITRDRILILGNEARAGPASITLYRWPGGS